MRHYYCSFVCKDFVYKGLLLYHSLSRCDADFHIYIVCLHNEVKELLQKMRLEKATLIPLPDVEKEEKEPLQVKASCDDREYPLDLKASACLYILNHFAEVDRIIWLAEGTYFFSDPDPIFQAWGDYSIVLTEEKRRGCSAQSSKEEAGINNTGFIGFKRDEYGRLENAATIQNAGVNYTPYRIKRRKVTSDGSNIYIDGQKLIFFHFDGFIYYDGNEFDLCRDRLSISDEVIRWIYLPYIHASNEMMEYIRDTDVKFFIQKKPEDYFISNYFNLRANELGDRDCPNLCTIVTRDYLARGLVLYNSLKKSPSGFHLWICCADNEAFKILKKMQLDSVTLIHVASLKNEKLTRIEGNRKVSEFCWTLKAPYILYLLQNNYSLKSVLYVDADLFFFKDIGGIYEEWGNDSIFLTRLWMGSGAERKYGMYSAGLIGFKRNRNAFRCLRWWERKCLKWCYDKIMRGRWSDQKYLDPWPQLFTDVKISENKGLNAGPWNIKRFKIQIKRNTVYLSGHELSVYHYSGFTIFNASEFEFCNRRRMPLKAKMYIYPGYAEAVSEALSYIESIDESFAYGISNKKGTNETYNYYFIYEH